jgi:hypothetical protein
MSAARPTVAPELVASMIQSTPDRVRRRLDRTPDAAESWQWQATDEAWSVDTGGETVTLWHGHIVSVDQIRCTCLLSPGCFHVLACLTRLQVLIVESSAPEPTASNEPAASESSEDLAEPDEKQRTAAREMVRSMAELLRVGVANAGVVVQSGLLRAVHQCRADGLHRLAALGLKVLTGISEFRARAATADPEQLATDACDILETTVHVLSERAINGFWIGTARRTQIPVRPRKLHGLFAEPIVTRSGFTGAAVYFLGEDDRFYTASDVRPGDPQRVRDAYLGGIEIGAMVQPAKQLARGLYLGTDMTASPDGRLGRGKGIKIVEQGRSSWQTESIQQRFRRPLSEQWETIYAQTALPADVRTGGWDLVFFDGTVLGAAGAELLVAPNTHASPIHLAIENECESLCFRENLRILSFAPGLRLQIIARLDLQEPRRVFPLAIASADKNNASDAPILQIPESLGDRVCLGFDEIHRNHLVNALDAPAVLHLAAPGDVNENPLTALRRRWVAALLSGLAGQRGANTKLLAIETATLKRAGFSTGAAMLDALTSTASSDRPSGVDTFLATGVYLQRCAYELAKSRALLAS